MARPVTLFTIQWGDLPLEEICKLARQMGYEGLELAKDAHFDARKMAAEGSERSTNRPRLDKCQRKQLHAEWKQHAKREYKHRRNRRRMEGFENILSR